MKKIILLLAALLLFSCSKDDDIIQEEQSKYVNVSFEKTLLDNYVIYFINEKNDTIKSNQESTQLKYGTYTIYAESIPNKMTWDNRDKCISTITKHVAPTFISDKQKYTIDKLNNDFITPKTTITAKEIKETTSTNGADLGSYTTYYIDCNNIKRYISLYVINDRISQGIDRNGIPYYHRIFTLVNYVPLCE